MRTLVVLFCLAVAAIGMPQLRRETVVQETDESAPIRSCEMPNFAQNVDVGTGGKESVCSKYVDYEVPRSVALIAPILDKEISNTLEQRNDSSTENYDITCIESLAEIQCRQYFPRCSEDRSEVILSSLDCEATLSMCEDSGYDGRKLVETLRSQNFCGLQNAVVPIDDCKPLSQYEHSFDICRPDGDWLFTDWMFELMKLRETTAAATVSDSSCQLSYNYYTCGVYGRCSSDASRVLFVNTQVSCEQTLDCIDDANVMFFQNFMPCSLWPVSDYTAPTLAENQVSEDVGNPQQSTTSSDDDTTTSASATPQEFSSSAPLDQLSISLQLLTCGVALLIAASLSRSHAHMM